MDLELEKYINSNINLYIDFFIKDYTLLKRMDNSINNLLYNILGDDIIRETSVILIDETGNYKINCSYNNLIHINFNYPVMNTNEDLTVYIKNLITEFTLNLKNSFQKISNFKQ